MKTKLTLRLEEELIAVAKKEATDRGTSISQIVANFFKGLQSARQPARQPKYGPITSELLGMIKGSKVTEEDYKRYLEKKYL